MSINSDNVTLALGLAALVELAILYAAKLAIKRVRGGGFWDFAKGPDGWPSLARLQAVLWTIMIIFSFLSVYFVRLQAGLFETVPDIPKSLLMLAGITIVGVPIAANEISKKGEAHASGGKTKTETRNPEAESHPWGTILEEKDRPSTTRFQMFAFTCISIIFYLALLLSVLYDPNLLAADMNALRQLTIPDIDPTLVALMGLSQAGYVAGKYSETVKPKQPD